jgi:nitrogen fixation protein FixH
MNWAYVPAGLLVAMVTGLLSLAHIAGDDPGFAVERDYYQKASHWDAAMAQQARNQDLGWQAELALTPLPTGMQALTLKLRDRAGAAIEGAHVTVEAFHNARAASPLDFELLPGPDGYAAVVDPGRPGLWEFRVEARKADERFTTVIRRSIEGRP